MLLEQALVQLFHRLHNPLFHFHHIRTDLPAHAQGDVGDAVAVGVKPHLEGRQLGVAHIPQADEGAVAAGDDHVFYVFRGLETPDGSQQVAAFAAVQIAPGNIAVAGPYGGAQLGQGDLPLRQPRRVHIDLDLPFRPAPHRHLRHPRHPLQTGANMVLQEIAHLRHVDSLGVARQGPGEEKQEGIVGKGTGRDAGLVDILRVTRHLAQGVVDPDQHFVEVRAVGKLQLDVPAAGGGIGDHALQAGDAAQVFFLFDDDFLFHILGRRPGPASGHGDGPHI